ncbi:MAG: TVP38/TMEM64 family protein [Syntrophobacteraceae bacterium]|nr:TVP38/TMEM64 family protein [Syntrophobacteraceae bacterium]
MKEIAPGARRRTAWVKALFLACFFVAAIALVHFTRVSDYLQAKTLSRLLHEAGPWAPVLFILIYAMGVCILIPGTVLTGLGAAIFGPYLGFAYVWIGAMAGAAGAFLLGRTLGRDFATSLIGEKLKKYDEAIERNGFATVLYLRLIYFPFSAMNYGMGLTRVRFRDYFLGTAIGIIVGTFVFTFFIGTLRDVWASGQWGQLLTPRVFISLGLFVFSFFIPKIIRKMSKGA